MNCNLSTSDIINLIGLIVHSTLAVYIVIILQKNLANKRHLKDFLISEIKDLRFEYKKFFNELCSGNLRAKKIIPWLKLLNIKSYNTLNIINKKYKVEKNYLNSYQVELRELVTELDEFNSNYNGNKKLALKEESFSKLIKFQQENSSKFSSIIIMINEK
jgi:hypothetical protein